MHPVGVSGSTGRVDCGESCEVVSFQVSSGVEVRGEQNKNARVEVSEEWELFEKNIPRAAYPFFFVHIMAWQCFAFIYALCLE